MLLYQLMCKMNIKADGEGMMIFNINKNGTTPSSLFQNETTRRCVNGKASDSCG